MLHNATCCPGYSGPLLAPKLARGDTAVTAAYYGVVALCRRSRWRVTMPVRGHATVAAASYCTGTPRC